MGRRSGRIINRPSCTPHGEVFLFTTHDITERLQKNYTFLLKKKKKTKTSSVSMLASANCIFELRKEEGGALIKSFEVGMFKTEQSLGPGQGPDLVP